MSEPDTPAAQGDDGGDSEEAEELQFEQAEYTTPTSAGPTCAACKRPIKDDYYEINGKIICPTCRHQIEASFRGGSRFLRVMKAFLLGSVGAVAGAVLYYVIVRVTNWNIGLVSVLVGFMVGTAVRKGSGNRGGSFYQVLALFLTYSAIAGMLAPFWIEAMINQAQQNGQPGGVAADAPGKAPANAKAAPPAAKAQPAQAKEAPDKEAVADKKDGARAELHENGAQAAQEPELPALVAGLLFFLVHVIGLVYTLPIEMGIGDPLSGLIYSFALWEAWRINKPAQLVFSGPFRVSPEGPPTSKPEVVDDDV